MNALHIIAHTGHEEATPAAGGFVSDISHWPAWAGLGLALLLLFALYHIFSLFKVRLLNRLLLLVPAILGLAIFFMSHNPIVSTVLLSGGFIGVFLLVFTLLSNQKSSE